jgi:cytochrome c-type biogenesis protein CcmE
MKIFQKLIIPGLLVLLLVLVYLFYFAQKGLGSFSEFDPNNNANKDIKVRIVKEKGISRDQQGIIFYAVDKNGTEVLVQAPMNLPASLEAEEEVILRGHLHKEYFHASEVLLE